MISDPLNLQDATGDVVYDKVSVLGSKSIYTRRAESLAGGVATTLTISHDENQKSGRLRSVLRLDHTLTADDGSGVPETCAAYLVLDRVKQSPIEGNSAGHLRNLIAQLLSFFTTDPTAAASGNLDYNVTTTLGSQLIAGQS
jgi:hypothetical protein